MSAKTQFSLLEEGIIADMRGSLTAALCRLRNAEECAVDGPFLRKNYCFMSCMSLTSELCWVCKGQQVQQEKETKGPLSWMGTKVKRHVC